MCRLGRVLALSCALLIGLSGCAPEPEPRALFDQARRAIESIEEVSYSFRFRPDADPYYRDRLEGQATLRRLDLSGSAFLARAAARVLPPDGEDYTIEVLRGPTEVRVLDHGQKSLRWSSLAAFGPVLQAAVEPAMMYAFYDPHSLAGEAEADSVVLEGSGQVAGEPCWWVRVSYADDEEDSRWCFGKRDSLPLAMEWISTEGRRTLEIFEIETSGSANLDPRSDSERPVDIFASLEAPSGYEVAEASFGPPKGSLAKDWTLAGPDGESISLEEQRGSVVVLDFFATWCLPCAPAMKGLERLLTEFVDQPVRAFAVNTMESMERQEVAAFLEDLGVTYPLLLAGDDVHQAYANGSIPATVVLDTEGRRVGMAIGYLGDISESYLRELIEKALAG